jgi:hypothetical protein
MRMTDKPVDVNPSLAAMCAPATVQQHELARKQFGPHALTSIHVYMNQSAAETFRQGAVPYLVGSVIVKEKLASRYASNGAGGMIKRPAGYDPEHGDWEYFYVDDSGKIETGRISSCIQCHAGAAKQDYVFGHWSKVR